MQDIPPDAVVFGIDYSKASDWRAFVMLWALEHKPAMVMLKKDFDAMPEKVRTCCVILEKDQIPKPAPGPHQRESGLIVA